MEVILTGIDEHRLSVQDEHRLSVQDRIELWQAEDWPEGFDDLKELVIARVDALEELFDTIARPLNAVGDTADGVHIIDEDGLSLEVDIDMHALVAARSGRQDAKELLRIIEPRPRHREALGVPRAHPARPGARARPAHTARRPP